MVKNHRPFTAITEYRPVLKEKLTDKKPLPSKVEDFITYIGNQIRSDQFLQLIAVIHLAFCSVL